MNMYQFKTFVVLFMFSVSVFGNTSNSKSTDFRTTLRIYTNLKHYTQELDAKRTQNASTKTLVLKDFHLLIDSGTWCAPCLIEQKNWEALAKRYDKKLNIISIYDNGQQPQNRKVIDQFNESPYTFHFFDAKRDFYHFFKTPRFQAYSPNGIYPLGILIGPNSDILFEGVLVKTGDSGIDPLVEIEKLIANYKRNSI